MPSTYFGIYTAQRSLAMNQAAMNVVSSNIANMNTEGYSKQRVEFSQKMTLNTNSYLPEVASQNGLGATIDSITRNRDVYLDSYFREENSDLSYFEQLNSTTILIEDISNELGGTGISDSLNDFYDAAQTLASNPTDIVTRTNFLQNAVDVCTRFNNTDEQLENLRVSLVGDGVNEQSIETSSLGLAVDDLNTIIQDISTLNNTIALTTAQGSTPNNLLDKRDILLDELSEFIPIEVTQEVNNLISVQLGNIDLIQGDKLLVNFNTTIPASPDNEDTPCVITIEDMDGGIVSNDASELITSGQIGALITLGGNDSNNVTIKGLQDDLNLLAKEFARELNTIQDNGQYIDTSGATDILVAQDSTNYIELFVDQDGVDNITDYDNLTASSIRVNENVLDNPFYIATANVSVTAGSIDNPEYTGDSTNALAIAKLRDVEIANLNNSTTESYLNAINSALGIKSSSIYDNYDAQSQIVDEVEQRRTSAIGVSLDEEYIDLVKYQKAYQASSKVFNIMDENLQTILNLV